MSQENYSARRSFMILLLGAIGCFCLLTTIWLPEILFDLGPKTFWLVFRGSTGSSMLFAEYGWQWPLVPFAFSVCAAIIGAIAMVLFFKLRRDLWELGQSLMFSAKLGIWIVGVTFLLSLWVSGMMLHTIYVQLTAYDKPLGTTTGVLIERSRPPRVARYSVQVGDTLLVIIGKRDQQIKGQPDIPGACLVMTGFSGAVKWEKQYPNSIGDVTVSADKNLIVALSPPEPGAPVRFVKLSAAGDSLTGWRWDSLAHARLHGIVTTADGSYIVRGTYQPNGKDTGFLIKMSPEGKILWQTDNDNLNFITIRRNRPAMIALRDGGVVGFGSFGKNDDEDGVKVVWKVSAAGKIGWIRKEEDRRGAVVSMFEEPDGTLDALSQGGGRDVRRYTLERRSSDGAVMYEREIANPLSEWMQTLMPGKDGGYIVTGTGWTRVIDNKGKRTYSNTFSENLLDHLGATTYSFVAGYPNFMPFDAFLSAPDYIILTGMYWESKDITELPTSFVIVHQKN